MAHIPFAPDAELNKELAIEDAPLGIRISRSDGHSWGLPGQPRVAINNSGDVEKYLVEEHLTSELDILAPRLWLVCNGCGAEITRS